jgi:hypothetical protein
MTDGKQATSALTAPSFKEPCNEGRKWGIAGMGGGGGRKSEREEETGEGGGGEGDTGAFVNVP